MNKNHRLLFLDNGAYEVRGVLDGKPLPVQPNIAFKIPSSFLSAGGGDHHHHHHHHNTEGTTTSNSTVVHPSSHQWITGDEIDRAPFSILSRCRGKRPLGLGSILVDAPLQARIWRRLLYVIAGLQSEMDIDLVVTVQPGTPKEAAVLWHTLCFVLFKFRSVTFVVSGWVEFLGFASSSGMFMPAAASTPEVQPPPPPPSHEDNENEGNQKDNKKKTNKTRATTTTDQKKKKQQNNQKVDTPPPATTSSSSSSSSSSASSRIQNLSNASSFIVDVGYFGASAFAVVNGLPRRCGFLRQHIGMFHVGCFLARLISFTQMDLIRSSGGGAPTDLLVHRGIIEKSLQVDRRNSVHDHLLKWEKAWKKSVSSSTTQPAERANVFFQGTMRRRLRARDVVEEEEDNDGKNQFGGGGEGGERGGGKPSSPSHLATVRFVLPTGDDDFSLSASDPNLLSNKKKKKNGRNGNNKKQQLSNFGYVLKQPNSTTGTSKKHKDGDDDDDDDEEEEEEDDDAEEEDLAVLKLDHERFISSELLFHPEAVCGDVSISGRLAGAFGASANTVMSSLPSSSSAIFNSSSSCSVVAATTPKIKGGCVELLAETRRRFAPELVSPIIVKRALITGGGSSITGFGHRFKNEVDELISSPQPLEVVCCCGGGDDVHDDNGNKKEGTTNTAVSSSTRLFVLPAMKNVFAPAFLSMNCSDDDDDDAAAAAAAVCCDEQMKSVVNFLRKCRVVRSSDVDAKLDKATTKPQKLQAHEGAVDCVFAAMQSVLI